MFLLGSGESFSCGTMFVGFLNLVVLRIPTRSCRFLRRIPKKSHPVIRHRSPGLVRVVTPLIFQSSTHSVGTHQAAQRSQWGLLASPLTSQPVLGHGSRNSTAIGPACHTWCGAPGEVSESARGNVAARCLTREPEVQRSCRLQIRFKSAGVQ